MRISVREKLFGGFGAALFVIGVLALVGYSNIASLTTTSAQVTHTHEVLSGLASILSSLKDAETGQRGLVITGEEHYLVPYNSAIARVRREIGHLRALTIDNPAQTQRVDALLPLVDDKFAELLETIQLRRTTGFEAARDVVVTDAGQQIMNDIRSVMAAMEQEEVDLLETREAAAASSASNAKTIIMFATVAAFLLLSGVAFSLSRKISGGVSAVAQAMKKISQGDLSEEILLKSSDEIGDMAASYREMQAYLIEAADAATQIGQGELDISARPRSPLDALGNARAAMVHNLKQHAHAAELMADGDLTVEFGPLSDRDTLGIALANMVARLRWMVGTLEEAAAQRQQLLALAEARATSLKRSNEELDALFRIARQLSAPGPFDENAQAMLAVVAEIVGADRAVLRLPDEERQELIVVAGAGPLATAHPPVVLAKGAGVSWHTFETGEVVVEQDHEPGGRTGRAIRGEGARSSVTLPITSGEAVSGVLKVSSRLRGFFDDNAVRLLTGIANSLGVLVENARLRESLERSIRALENETAERVQAVESLEVERALRVRVDNFVSIASHELRTPMTTLVGYSELLLTNEPPAEVRREWFQLINTESKRLTEILNEFLSVSRINAGTVQINRERLALPALARQVVGGLEMTSHKHQFEVAGGNDVPDVIGDRDKLLQVLGNLLDNAAKYSPEGGNVAVSFRLDEEQGQVITSVRDQGIGIAPRDQARVFEMFERARSNESITIRGTGVGLHVVKSFVDLMGGAVWVSSRRHHGSTFSFALPIAMQAPQEGAAAAAA